LALPVVVAGGFALALRHPAAWDSCPLFAIIPNKPETQDEAQEVLASWPQPLGEQAVWTVFSPFSFVMYVLLESGWGEIRTPGGLSPTAVFKTAALDHSATHPNTW
jgi:hypothetical protein